MEADQNVQTVEEITCEMKKLHDMSRFLANRLSTLENKLSDARDVAEDDEDIFEDADIDSDDEIIEITNPDPKDLVGSSIVSLISPKKEPVIVQETDTEKEKIGDIESTADHPEDEDLDEESQELLNMEDSYVEEEESEPEDEEIEDVEEKPKLVGHIMDEDIKNESVELSDFDLPEGWTVRNSKKQAGRFFFNSPDGRYFHTLHTVLEWMLKNDFPKKDVEVMKTNLKFEGWREVDYLPAGWLIVYYKPSNNFHYLSPDCQLFKSCKAATKFMIQNHYNPSVIEDLKRELMESKKFTGKIKFKWQTGDKTLPLGWKLRKARGSGKNRTMVEFILSDDGIQFKSRFEALHFMINNKYSTEKTDDLREKLLVSSEKWQESEYLPKGWIFKFKGDASDRDKNPASTAITYFSR